MLIENGYTARRGWQSRGAEFPDIISNFPFYIEVKLQNRLNIYQAIDQVNTDNKTDSPGIVVFRKDHGEWYVTMKWKDFINKCK